MTATVGLFPVLFGPVPSMAQASLKAEGVVESTSGGLRFPDDTVQPTASQSAAYAEVVVVAKSGGDHSSIQSALDGITDAASDKRYLVRIAPGIYDEQVTLKSFVDLVGSGQLTTRIESSSAPTVTCADDAELRFLTVVRPTGSGAALHCDGTDPRLVHVGLWIEGTSGDCYGLRNINGAHPRLESVEVLENSTCSTSYGISNEDGSSPVVDGLQVAMFGGGLAYGIANEGGTPRFRDVSVEIDGAAGAYGMLSQSSTAAVLQGARFDLDGTSNGYGIREQTNCSSSVSDVRVSLGGGFTSATGVMIAGFSSTTVERASIEITGSGNGTGVYFLDASNPRVSTLEIEVTRTGVNYGLSAVRSSFEAGNVGLVVEGGTFDRGVNLSSNVATARTVRLDDSSIRSEDETIFGDAEYEVLIGNTMLAGDAVSDGGGTITCAGVWDESYSFSESSCP